MPFIEGLPKRGFKSLNKKILQYLNFQNSKYIDKQK